MTYNLFELMMPKIDFDKAKPIKLFEAFSGLVWEVTRIIKETKVKPKVLLMENVTDLVGKKFIRGFNEFQNMLGELGYTNWTCVVNALDCNVAQNRARIFMVSTLGNYAYSFPFKLEKTKVLKDYLEDKVDKRYYISEKLLMVFLDTKDRNGYIRATRFTPQDKDSDYAFTITTRAGQRTSDNFIIESNIKKMSQETINIIKNQIKGIELPYKTLEMVGRLERQEISIRRLTELECWRLMGISDEDFNKAKASGVSNAQLYKQAGNAIVVDVLYHIFKNMFKEE